MESNSRQNKMVKVRILLYKANGKPFWCELTVTPLWSGADSYSVCIHVDITKNKHSSSNGGKSIRETKSAISSDKPYSREGAEAKVAALTGQEMMKAASDELAALNAEKAQVGFIVC